MKIESSLRSDNSLGLYLQDNTVLLEVKKGYVYNHFSDGNGDSDIELTLEDLVKLNKWVSKKIKAIEAYNKLWG